MSEPIFASPLGHRAALLDGAQSQPAAPPDGAQSQNQAARLDGAQSKPTAPLDGLGISMAELTEIGMIDLRGHSDDQRFVASIRRCLGLDLPTIPRRSTQRDQISLLWLSPDQWLVLLPRAEALAMVAALQAELADTHALVCDVSDMRAIIRLGGQGVREVLMKATSTDLFSSEVNDGYVRRASFAGIASLIHVVSTEPEIYDLYVFRSYADFTWDWLLKTAGERSRLRLFGPQPPPPV